MFLCVASNFLFLTRQTACLTWDSNLKFARTAEPDNQQLPALEARMQALRDAGQPTLPSSIGQEKATNPFVRVTEAGVMKSASSRAGKPLTDPVSVLGEIRDWKNNF